MPTVFSKSLHYDALVTFLDKEYDPNEPVNLSEHIVKEELQLCFKKSSAEGTDNLRIKDLKPHHVDRYITHGCACKLDIVKEGRKLFKRHKVLKVKQYTRNRIQAKVIGNRFGDYKVAIQFQPGVISGRFNSTRDIKQSQCSGCGKNSRCRHTAALLLSVCDKSRYQQPLTTQTPYKV